MPCLIKILQIVQGQLNQGIYPVDIGKNSAFVGTDKVLIKCPKGRYFVEVSDTKVE